jgi:RNA polymerase sigma-70 factor (ECF subfamily)
LSAQQPDISLLLEGCKRNERKAQEALYRHFYPFAAAIALRYVKNNDDMADVVSLAFIKLFKALPVFDTKRGSFHAWFKTIVIHEALDHIKSRSKYTDNHEVADAEEIAVDNTALDNISIGEIMNMIRKLPPATHAVFVLYVMEGYNHREIAQQLNISEGTSKWHLSEARRSLKQQLEQNKK